MAQVQERIDVYSLVTNQIIKQLENNIVPWQKPWNDNSIPQNLITRIPYRGINLLLLASLGYEQNLFLTFKQAQAIGANVKKGEKGHLIVFWKKIERNKSTINAEEDKPLFVLRYFKVFNIAQCDNVSPTLITVSPEVPFSPISYCEQIIHEMAHCPNIIYEQSQAFYEPVTDYINMPKPETFKDNEVFYSVLFHELIHSTGHTSRLARKGVATPSKFGDPVYSLEELTAEIGACFLTSFCGIASHNLAQSVSYINGWLKALQNDKKLIVQASGQAQRATDYILNVRGAE
ncbi:MAG: ssDNA-binding domain-containing protein [Gammaproteobacteria bacterium]|nr:ssDNA-binding domain-containing protein [Gammaproteobacteria bacterium]